MPFRIYRRGTGEAQLAALEVAADTTAVFPIPGFRRLTVEGRSPAGNWTLAVSTGPKSGGTATVTASFTCTVAVPLHLSLDLEGELGALTLTNGAAAQRPEVLVTLEEMP